MTREERLLSIISEIWEGGICLVCVNKNDIIYIYEEMVMKNLVTTCVCAFSLLACGSGEKSEEIRNDYSGTQTEQTPTKESMTESQVFAYILGGEYAKSLYLNTPPRIGEMLDLDAMVQGIVDNEKTFSDSNWVLQVPLEEQKSLDAHYDKVAKDRTVLGENARPIALAGPITGQKVVITDTTPMIVKYSYTQGVTIDIIFNGMRETFSENFEGRFFIQGVRESIYEVIDPSFKKTVSDERLQTVNMEYKKRLEKIREERRRQ